MRCALIASMIMTIVTLPFVMPTDIQMAGDPVDSCVLVYSADGHGSGVIVGINCVLTARHVADNPGLTIRTNAGDEHPVVFVVVDEDSDMALLYIEGRFSESITPLLIDRTPLRVGDEVTLIGAPFDRMLQNCVLRGRVVKIDLVVDNYGYEIGAENIDVLDCHGGPGCSGGPVLDSLGRVRGVLILGIGPLCGAVPVGELNL